MRIREHLLALATVLAAVLAQPAVSDRSRRPNSDAADWLLGRDGVVLGTVVERHDLADSETMGPAHGSTQYTIRISRVLLGVLGDSALVLRSLAQDLPPPGALVTVGQPVLAYFNRLPNDGWHAWGGIAFIGSDSSLWPPRSFGGYYSWLRGVTDVEPVPCGPLFLRLVEQKGRSAVGALDGADGIALVRLDRYESSVTATRYTSFCDSLRWVIPCPARVPRRLVFEGNLACQPDFGPGREILLPIHAGASADSAMINACPHGWVVEAGYVRGLGVRLEDIGRAIEVRDGKVHVRAFLAAGPPPSSEH